MYEVAKGTPVIGHGIAAGHAFAGKVLSLLEACFDLISSPSLSMKIQIMGGKIIENLEFKSPHPEGHNFFVLFFQILHTKLGIFDLNHFLYLVLLFRNQKKHLLKMFIFWRI